jgi:hypothetical protein
MSFFVLFFGVGFFSRTLATTAKNSSKTKEKDTDIQSLVTDVLNDLNDRGCGYVFMLLFAFQLH